MKGKSSKEISNFFVDYRGQIHHQSKKNKKRGWHPANQQEFKFEANLFMNVCLNLMLPTAIDLMYGTGVDLETIKVFQMATDEKSQ